MIKLHKSIKHSEATHMARLMDCAIVPDPKKPGDYIVTPRRQPTDYRGSKR